MKKLLVSIPAYNEEKTLGKVLDNLHEVLKKEHSNYEIQVVNDGSSDKTQEVAIKHGAKVISHGANRGLAQTFRTEMRAAAESDADIIVHTDADGQYRASDIPKILGPVLSNDADLVLGSRFKGTIEKMPFIKRFGNRAFSRVISSISGLRISDAQTGFRAFTKQVAKDIKTISNFTYTQEQIIRGARLGLRIKEVPIYFDIRGANTKSRLMKNPFDFALRAGINLLRIYRDYRPLRFFGMVGFFFLIVGIGLGIWILYNIFTTGSAGGIPRVILSALGIITGVQILLFGFLADMKAD